MSFLSHSKCCLTQWHPSPESDLQYQAVSQTGYKTAVACSGCGSRVHRLLFTQPFCPGRWSSSISHPGAEHQASAHCQLHLGGHQLDEQLWWLVSYCHPLGAERYRRPHVTPGPHICPVCICLPVGILHPLLIRARPSAVTSSRLNGVCEWKPFPFASLLIWQADTQGLLMVFVFLFFSYHDKNYPFSGVWCLPLADIIPVQYLQLQITHSTASQGPRLFWDSLRNWSLCGKVTSANYGGSTVARLRHWCKHQPPSADTFLTDVKTSVISRKSLSVGIWCVLNFAVWGYLLMLWPWWVLWKNGSVSSGLNGAM